MDFHSVIQGVLTNWLSDLLILGAGILLGLLKKQGSRWLGPVSYGLGGIAAMSIIIFAFTGHPVLSTETPHTTVDNVEANVQSWANDLSLGIQKQPTNDQLAFSYAISVASGRVIVVSRPKQSKNLQFEGTLAIAPEHLAILNKLPPPQLERVMDEVQIEMARNRTGFALLSAPTKGVWVGKAVPITSDLTEQSFASALNEIDSSLLLAREAVRLALIRNDIASNVTPHPPASR